ncbi:uncharacterized protein LODBEIA_P13590 [Lodderomyces beijingensis]|uniref:ubiquitinyl hydrolase 1 n=1 Tax=Lodderomyces beijingensis TaxID=1775926 RepID=A0ABP0ZG35_9ASCO
MKHLTLSSHHHAQTNTEKPIFADSYWQAYIESYLGNDRATVIKHTPYNITKYTEKSHEVLTIRSYFQYQKLPVPSTLQIIAILKSPLTQGNLYKTYYIIRMFQLSSEGYFLTNSPIDKLGNRLHFVGAENWDNVMCYMDALFFAMFANLESFEPLLFIPNSNNQLVNQLSALMRVYVSLLRSGYLITTDLTAKLCECLQKLGFDEAMSHRQQDASALFGFLTEILSMPLLTFKVDIKHAGKFSKKDDQKYSKERMLFVSIPGEDEEVFVQRNSDSSQQQHHIEGSSSARSGSESDNDEVMLEECLEHYFNNEVSVKRELERRASQGQIPTIASLGHTPRVDVIKEDVGEPSFGDVEHRFASGNGSEAPRIPPRTRASTLSIWSLNDHDRSDPSKIREVNLPAWMFLRLLPFYTDDNVMSEDFESTARSSKDFANRRPVLPICLKRYENSGARSQKRIIIPPFIDLPDFVADDIDGPGCSFRLILESAVCHRGTSISSGHFVSVVRKNIDQVNQSEEEAEAATWLLYDDMKKSQRVVEKTFNEIFTTEWPYTLFYRLVSPNPSSGASSVTETVAPPPPGSKVQYWASTNNFSHVEAKKLSPILSSETRDTVVVNNFPDKTPTKQVVNTEPVSSVAPNDPKFVDLRRKYYWFFTDESRNYYKEDPVTSRDGNSKISLSPQFRRNSQWSNFSGISHVELDPPSGPVSSGKSGKSVYDTAGTYLPPPTSDIPIIEEKSPRVNPVSPSLWKRSTKRTSPNAKAGSTESVAELQKLVSPMNLEDSSAEYDATTRKPSSRPSKEVYREPKQHARLFHRSKTKRDAYKKEKCIIT